MGHTSPIDQFLLQHKAQLQSSAVPEIYWESLYKKLLSENLDAGKSFQLVKIDYDRPRKPHEPLWGLQALRDLNKNDPDNIYLIDHAWTFQVGQARQHLVYDQLTTRLTNILGLDDSLPKEELYEVILNEVWKVACTYSLQFGQDGSEKTQVWYVMDEIGCAVQHSDSPNCRVVPFFYLNGETYSLLFLQEDVQEGDLVFRDFAEGIQDPVLRKAALLPWVPASFDEFDVNPPVPQEEYFLSGHIPEILPDLKVSTLHSLEKKDKYLCFTQYDLIKKHLTDPVFELTDNPNEAEILWYTEHFRDFKKLSEENPGKLVNQFPYEYVLTVKDLLSITCRRYKNHTELAPWFPVTYNLVTEIGHFVKYFQMREQKPLDNYWIVKPYNLARGKEIQITNNLNCIMRLPVTGPKIAQKYLTNPVLFYRPECEGKVKFDIRYVILLKSVKPLQVYIYKDFFLRFANKPFELNNFDVYEQHFTVMNYTEGVTLKHMTCKEFKTEWQQQYDSYNWDGVEAKILEMFKDIMECATSVEAPCGIAANPQSRALYAADLMLDWQGVEMQPKILEINYMPDCERACNYYPDFYNDIFKLLFLDQENSNVFYKL